MLSALVSCLCIFCDIELVFFLFAVLHTCVRLLEVFSHVAGPDPDWPGKQVPDTHKIVLGVGRGLQRDIVYLC
jgi:hypothetical protein